MALVFFFIIIFMSLITFAFSLCTFFYFICRCYDWKIFTVPLVSLNDWKSSNPHIQWCCFSGKVFPPRSHFAGVKLDKTPASQPYKQASHTERPKTRSEPRASLQWWSVNVLTTSLLETPFNGMLWPWPQIITRSLFVKNVSLWLWLLMFMVLATDVNAEMSIYF